MNGGWGDRASPESPSHVLSWPGSTGSRTLCSTSCSGTHDHHHFTCPRGAPGPHPHLETSRRSSEDTLKATAATTAARETPRTSRTPGPWLGVPLPPSLARLLAPPRLQGARLLPFSACLAPPRRTQSLPWSAGLEFELWEPGRPSLAAAVTLVPRLAEGGERGKFLENLSGC